MPEPTIITLGCRLNAYESEVMRRHAQSAGLADAVIVNTCAVTSEAVRQAGQTVRRLRREHPHAKLIVTGCAAQTEPQRFAGLAEIDHVIGNADKLKAETFAALGREEAPRVLVTDIMSERAAAPQLIERFGMRARAYVEVQNGCDHRCTFCIIPFGRGPSRSVPAGDVVAQVRRLAQAGYGEVVLTGVDITSYGADLAGEASLGRLVRRVLAEVPELKRLRLSSIDQAELDAELLAALAEEPRLMPHLHLSMQSGDDIILKRMKRRHGRAQAIAFCDAARRARPDIAFGADLIAGFPTETEAMFQRTLEIVEACGLTFLHVFPFSPRSGTPAARMPQLPGEVVRERAQRLRDAGERVLAQHLAAQAGSEVEVLLERDGIGRTPQFTQMCVAGEGTGVGRLVKARVDGHDGRRLIGEVLA